MTQDPEIIAGGRVVPRAMDSIRRYCGQSWSEGAGGEVWAWSFYDQVPTPTDNRVSASDVLCASAIHPGLSRDDLEFFDRHAGVLAEWLTELDSETSLYSADDRVVEHLESLVEFAPHVSITLLSKVLHRKRPWLIPPLDDHLLNWYQPATGESAPERGWGPLLRAMRDDADASQVFLMIIFLQAFPTATRPDRIGGEARQCLSLLRATDIAVWMSK